MTKIELKRELKEIYNLLEAGLPEELLRRSVELAKESISSLIASLIEDTRKSEEKLNKHK
jgi:hypothetical protein